MQPMTQQEVDEAAYRLLEETAPVPQATRYRDDTELPETGDAMPVTQPGRPPMSQRAVDHSRIVLAYGAASLPIGGVLSLILHTAANMTTTQLLTIGAAPVGVVIAIGVAARMIGSAVREGAEALPREQHDHYEGNVTVHRTELHTRTRGLGRTVNRVELSDER